MDTRRIAELLRPFLDPVSNPCHSESSRRPGEEPAVLSATQLQHISTYIDILLRWNARINLTAIRDPEEIVTRHFGESLFAARHLFPKECVREGHDFSRADSAGKQGASAPEVRVLGNGQRPATNDRVADLGSGAGFPGLPIKLWAPHISLTLIESNHKKATFLREVTRALTLTNIDIQNTPAETIPGSCFDLVTLRAVERLSLILPVAASLLAPTGRLALLISSSQQPAIHATLPAFTWMPPIPIPLSSSRILLAGQHG
jgi:16S rRNA (guanine527-N7)-methyltransferase